ncbi:MAG: ATP-dependent zinc metalloprotease FtsH [Deltaproteobacteria bacterium]|nr:ATP-dependent zinc metalloprotease FtsH [Deltaproteobacteria bacterium]
MNRRNIALVIFFALLVLLVFVLVGQQDHGRPEEITFPALSEAVERGEVQNLTFRGEEISGAFTDGRRFLTLGPTDSEYFLKVLAEKGVVPSYEKEPSAGLFTTLLVNGLPILLIVVLFLFFMRQVQSGGGKAMSFGKSRARLLSDSGKRVTFADVAGVDEAKAELAEIILFLKEPKKFTRLGARIPKGLLLMGSPGTGKTLLARAIAGEAGVPFYLISGSDFVEMFVGVGASRVRDLFEQGKRNAPCIIFVDEIDAVGRQRGAGLGGGHDEREQTLNQLLVEMDGFESTDGVILVAATNRPDVLDPALLRPGRFDRHVVVPLPDVKGREQILKVHARKTPLAEDVDLSRTARGTPGFSGADLENLVNEAALQAAREDRQTVEMQDFECARDKIYLGAERRSLVMSDEERRTVAYHETGHALVAYLTPGADPVHKVTVVPRGRALGVTWQLPERDRYNESREFLLTKLTVLMGGRAAEEIAFDSLTTGARSDIEQATKIARAMVCDYGMSDRLGPVSWSDRQEEVFLGKEFGHRSQVSEHVAQMIDEEIRSLVDAGRGRARNILLENLAVLHKVAETLLQRETLLAEEFASLVDGLRTTPQGA